ncbi:hypothetical protein SAMN04488494_0985 [Xylanibacter ruminicola]|jgi:hypothetical protein|uniref:Uncharacterized protein n=1 Tax=Xylanibacter ruminicola TaxID=839 RepID=A0A1M7E7Y0_XYLRU|nr:hypothetical protein SAMN04488494_0985 [Xylanibacter ruminicola]
MTDFDTIWRTQDEIRTVVNAVLGECIWNLSYNDRRMAIELELTKYYPFLRAPRVLSRRHM